MTFDELPPEVRARILAGLARRQRFADAVRALAWLSDAVQILRDDTLPESARLVAARRLAIAAGVPGADGEAAALLTASETDRPPGVGWDLLDVDVWRSLVRLTRREYHRALLGPGWSRRVKGLDVVAAEELAGGRPADRDPLLGLRLADLAAAAPPRERELLDVVAADPHAKDADLAAVLGVAPSTARVLLHRLRKRAAGL